MSTANDSFGLELQSWIVGWLSRELDMPPAEIAVDQDLLTYGVDSVNAIMLVGDLEDRLKVRLAPTLVWDHPTVVRIVEQLTQIRAEQGASNQPEAAPSQGIGDLGIEEAKQLLDRLDELSESEVESLLARLAQE